MIKKYFFLCVEYTLNGVKILYTDLKLLNSD